MNLFKSLLRGLAAAGLKLSLVFLAVVTAAVVVFGTSAAIKQSLIKSKIYDNVVGNIVRTDSQTNDNKIGDTNLSLADPSITQAANTAFSPALIQSSTEQVIDGVYGWLRGKTTKPDFKIDLSKAKLQFATAAADNAAARARQLPACTLQQSLQLARSNPDPFTIPCLPPGTDINAARNQIISDLANSEELLKAPVINADSLPRDNTGHTVFDNLNKAPKIFQWMLFAPWILGGLLLFSGILLVSLYDEKRRGLRAVAIIMCGSGVFLGASTLIFNYAVNLVNKPDGPLGKLANNGLQSNFTAFFHSLSSDLNSKLLIFSAVYISIGAGLLLVLLFTKPKIKPSSTATGEDSMPQDALPPSPEISRDNDSLPKTEK